MTDRWSRIIECLFCMKQESINKEKILLMLRCDYTVDEQVLDNLYTLGVLSLDEYKEQIEKVVKSNEIGISACKERIKTLEEKGNKFNPMNFYMCGLPDPGRAIQVEMEKNHWKT